MTGIQNEEMYVSGPLGGAIFENYVVSEIKKSILHSATNSQMYFYRTSNHVEVDLIIENGLHKKIIEIKSSYTFKPMMVKPIESILSNLDEGFLLYQGDEFPFSESIKIWPYQKYLQRKF